MQLFAYFERLMFLGLEMQGSIWKTLTLLQQGKEKFRWNLHYFCFGRVSKSSACVDWEKWSCWNCQFFNISRNSQLSEYLDHFHNTWIQFPVFSCKPLYRFPYFTTTKKFLPQLYTIGKISEHLIWLLIGKWRHRKNQLILGYRNRDHP